MAQIIKACKFFIGNSSLGYDIAEGLKVPRLLEACPNFPVKDLTEKKPTISTTKFILKSFLIYWMI